MEKRITTISERAMTTTVNDIEHIESQSYNGVAVIRVFFQPKRQSGAGASRRSPRSCRRSCACCRRGSTPPSIVKYNASSVPILQLGALAARL